MKDWLRRRMILLLISVTALCCATLRTIDLFPESKDIELGAQIDQEIRKDPAHYPILADRPAVKTYIERLGAKILNSPDIKYKAAFAYKFEVIKDDSTVNAFCTPGGYVYVYTGLLKFLDNEASLAGVVGHEIAHAERRHATKRMTASMGAELLASIVLGQQPAQVAVIGANLFTGLGLLANSRADESEADTYSFKYLQSTEYYPGAIRFFFEKILSQSGTRGGLFEKLLSTHPLPQDRVDNVKKMLAQIGDPQPTEAQLLTQRYQAMKKLLP